MPFSALAAIPPYTHWFSFVGSIPTVEQYAPSVRLVNVSIFSTVGRISMSELSPRSNWVDPNILKVVSL